jgi:hypothetical protein
VPTANGMCPWCAEMPPDGTALFCRACNHHRVKLLKIMERCRDRYQQILAGDL